MQNPAEELEPWILVIGDDESTALALWKTDQQQDALALFSSKQLAEEYAHQHCSPPWTTRHLRQSPLIRVLAECYSRGIHYAALNPAGSSCRQMFSLRDVLKAARETLLAQRAGGGDIA